MQTGSRYVNTFGIVIFIVDAGCSIAAAECREEKLWGALLPLRTAELVQTSSE